MSQGEATDLFLTLTPEKVLEAVEAGGLRCNTLCYPLNSYENRVYEVELEDRSRVVAKFYRPERWSAEQILEEHRFLQQLDDDEIPVCPVLPFPDGTTLKRIDHIYYSLAERRGGRAPDELDDALARRLGMLVGRLHNVAAREPAPGRLELAADPYIRTPLQWLEERGELPRHLAERYFSAAEAIAKSVEERSRGLERHRIHGDLHLGNILLREGILRVLDFDDMAIGPAVQDLWLALPGRDPVTLRQRQLFVQGYETFRLFDRTSLRLIEPLRGLRLVHFAIWITRRFHDPAFKAAWPEHGSDDYWRAETETLEEQVAVIARDAPERPLASVESAEVEEEELTNRDFFWDWEGD